jgi:hypothetical protein
MSDSAPDVEAVFTALFAERSGSERVRMACEMFDTAKTLIAADLRARDPDITADALRVRMFERLYFGDFTSETFARIVAALRP